MDRPDLNLQPESGTNAYAIQTKSVPTFYFIGVTTGKSSINKVFPLWMKELGRPDVVLEGMDLKIHDTPAAYRAAVAQIKYDPQSIGALVTTHKIDLYEAAKDMFDYLDPYAELTGELSSISKRDGRLEGHAKDPITAGLSMDHITGAGYFGRTGGDVLIFGAGGSSVSTVLHLISKADKADRPRRIIVVNRSPKRLHSMQAMVDTLATDIEMTYIENADARRNDRIMADLPDGSIVVNATGMGKDTPGSPVTDDGLFPRHGIAWEFNYRGELDFLHQAERQAESRNLFVEDGWVYFVHGWSQVVGQVLHVEITDDVFGRLERAAATVRG
ncbi:MAG: shikimate dehydrogenase [Anaerolineae bacterium]